MFNNINTGHLKVFVEALQNLPTEVRRWEIEVGNNNEADGKKKGCFATLVYFAAMYVPELEKIRLDTNKEIGVGPNDYDRISNRNALCSYLGFNYDGDTRGLEYWAYKEMDVWDSGHGNMMFTDNKAYTKEKDLIHVDDLSSPKLVLLNQDVINWWAIVLRNTLLAEERGEVMSDLVINIDENNRLDLHGRRKGYSRRLVSSMGISGNLTKP